MAVNWNMGVMPNVGGNALAMFERGREMKREDDTRNALAAYATNPNEQTLAPVMSYEPRLGIQLQGQRQQQAAQQQQQALKAQEARDEYIANSAYHIVTLPEAQRGPAWDSYIAQGAERFPELAQYRGQYSPERLNSIVAKAGQMPQFQKFQQPDYVPVGEGGLSGFQYGVPIMAGQQAQNFGTPGAPPATPPPVAANIIPDRPANMTDDQLWTQAHDAVRNGANADDVFRQLQAWGVNP